MATTRCDETKLDELPEMAKRLEQPGYDAARVQSASAEPGDLGVKRLMKWIRCALAERH